MWFHFRQNNTGGSFTQNNDVDVNVFIEADTPEMANNKALDVGIYFDGVAKGRDCECCGDRWCEVDAWEKVDRVPPSYFKRDDLNKSIFYYKNGFKSYGKHMKVNFVVTASPIPVVAHQQEDYRRLELP